MRRVLALIIFGAIAAPASACLNDSELPSHEREFRSNYGDPAEPAPPPPTIFAGVASHPVLLGVGAALLTGAFVVTLSDIRARRKP